MAPASKCPDGDDDADFTPTVKRKSGTGTAKVATKKKRANTPTEHVGKVDTTVAANRVQELFLTLSSAERAQMGVLCAANFGQQQVMATATRCPPTEETEEDFLQQQTNQNLCISIKKQDRTTRKVSDDMDAEDSNIQAAAGPVVGNVLADMSPMKGSGRVSKRHLRSNFDDFCKKTGLVVSW